MLELDVIPERSIGCEQWELVLGMHFSQAVAIIQSQVGVIKDVQVIYNDLNPLDYDLILHLPRDGIRLIFDSVSQRLKMIKVFRMKSVKLKYCNYVFNSPEILPTVREIEQNFGATHPGVYDTEKRTFTLNFRGLSFLFDVDSKFQPGMSQCGLGSLQFAAGISPVVSQMIIYSGSGGDLKFSSDDGDMCRIPVPVVPLPAYCYYGLPFADRVDVIRDSSSTKGFKVSISLQASGNSSKKHKVTLTKEVYFGMSCQDVLTLLGSPSQIFYKSEDKMKIHSPNSHLNVTTPRRSDYFFNYFSLGLDLLFDAKTQRLKKFAFHTNFPGHYNFNAYIRCNFVINLSSTEPEIENCQDKLQVTAYTKWEDVSEQFNPSERPVVLNRAATSNGTNPFGSTFCYGHQDMIFEVMQNQYIASVSFYKTQNELLEYLR